MTITTLNPEIHLERRISNIERHTLRDLISLIVYLQQEKYYRRGMRPHHTQINVAVNMLRLSLSILAGANNAADIKKAACVFNTQEEMINHCCRAPAVDLMCKIKNGLSGAEGGYKTDHP